MISLRTTGGPGSGWFREKGHVPGSQGGDVSVSPSEGTSGSLQDFKGRQGEIGPIHVDVYRTGPTENDRGSATRGLFFTDNLAEAEQYASLHPGNSPVKYEVSAKNAYVTASHKSLHRELYNGKELEDAVAAVARRGGSSAEAWKKVEEKMAATLRKKGVDALIYTRPYGRDVVELALLNPVRKTLLAAEAGGGLGSGWTKGKHLMAGPERAQRFTWSPEDVTVSGGPKKGNAMIRKEGGKFVLYTKDGSKKLGTFDSQEEALAREAQIKEMRKARNAADPFLTIDEVEEVCLPCAERMRSRGLKALRSSVLDRMLAREIAKPESMSSDELRDAITASLRKAGAHNAWVRAVYPEDGLVIYETGEMAAAAMFQRSFEVDSDGTVVLLDDVIPVKEARTFLPREAAGTVGKPKKDVFEGREHVVLPVVALVEGVIHASNAPDPEFVAASEFEKTALSWNGRPVVYDHPTNKAGEKVSANDPKVLAKHRIGTIFNARVEKGKLLMDAWIDPVLAKERGAEELLNRAAAGETLEVSVGTFVDTFSKKGTHNGRAYSSVWSGITSDHLALLPKGIEGACSVKMGCGTRAAAAASDDLLPLFLSRLLRSLGGPGSGWFRSKGHVTGSQGGVKGDGTRGGGTFMEGQVRKSLNQSVEFDRRADHLEASADRLAKTGGTQTLNTEMKFRDQADELRGKAKKSRDFANRLAEKHGIKISTLSQFPGFLRLPRTAGGPGSGWTRAKGHVPGSQGGGKTPGVQGRVSPTGVTVSFDDVQRGDSITVEHTYKNALGGTQTTSFTGKVTAKKKAGEPGSAYTGKDYLVVSNIGGSRTYFPKEGNHKIVRA